MNRLSLDAFKAKASESETQELENLTGGILGACHCAGHDADGSGLVDTLGEIADYWKCVIKGDGDVVH